MTDRELLELAAKAAGIDKEWKEWRTSRIGKFQQIEYTRHEGFNGWNPITDDGDALRLAVKLGIAISIGIHDVQARIAFAKFDEPMGIDEMKATRRAIVRAAAEIGNGMKS